MAPDAFWRHSAREFLALKSVYDASQYRWAVGTAMFANAHFRQSDQPAFEPEHFLGKKSRAIAPANPAVMKAVLDLAMGTGTVPDWALKASPRRS